MSETFTADQIEEVAEALHERECVHGCHSPINQAWRDYALEVLKGRGEQQ